MHTSNKYEWGLPQQRLHMTWSGHQSFDNVDLLILYGIIFKRYFKKEYIKKQHMEK
jgi:hypothetical protein